MSTKLPQNNFEWIIDSSKDLTLIKISEKNYNEESYVLSKLIFYIPKNKKNFIMIQHIGNLHDKTEYVFHIKFIKS